MFKVVQELEVFKKKKQENIFVLFLDLFRGGAQSTIKSVPDDIQELKRSQLYSRLDLNDAFRI